MSFSTPANRSRAWNKKKWFLWGPTNRYDTLQDTIQHISDWSKEKLFQLHPGKCKELTISFRKQPVKFNPIIVNGHLVESIPTAKILRVTVSNDMKWNDHIEAIIGKASKRLYLLRQLKRADVKSVDLVRFYFSCIRSVLDNAQQIFHSNVPRFRQMSFSVYRKELRMLFFRTSLIILLLLKLA